MKPSETLTEGKLMASLNEALSGREVSSQQQAFLKQLLAQGLPTTRHEEYKFTPVTRELEKHITGFRVSEPSGSFTVPELPGAAVIRIINGTVSPFTLPSGLQVISEGAEEPVTSDPFALMNAALRKQSLRIQATGTVDVPLHIHYHSEAGQDGSADFPSVEFVIRKNASLTLVETYSQAGGHSFSSPSFLVSVEEEGRVDHLRIQDLSGSSTHVTNSVIRQSDRSLVNTFVLTSGGNLIRNNFTLIIDGTAAEGNLLGLYLLKGKTLADNHTVVDHRKPGSNSNELYKGVMQGQTKGVFNGKIFVRPDAQKTNAFQSNRNIVLSDAASVNTKPQLEIWADDVKCSHGCTTGQLDEEGIFYLMSRGIDKATASAMMLDAFAGEVTERIQSAPLRQYAAGLVAETIASLQ